MNRLSKFIHTWTVNVNLQKE